MDAARVDAINATTIQFNKIQKPDSAVKSFLCEAENVKFLFPSWHFKLHFPCFNGLFQSVPFISSL